MTWEQFNNLIQWVGLPVAIFIILVGGLVFAVKVISTMWPRIRLLVKLIDVLIVLPEKIDKITSRLDGHDEKLKEIRHEVTANDGGSLKDSTRRNENSVEVIARHLGLDVEAGRHVPPSPLTAG